MTTVGVRRLRHVVALGPLRAWVLTLGLLVLAGCQPTALVIVVDAEEGLELDEITIVATRAGAPDATTVRFDPEQRSLPASLTVRAPAGTEVRVEVRGARGGIDVSRERASTSLLGGRALRLPILLRACTDGSERVIEPERLADWNGEAIVEREAGVCPMDDAGDGPDAGADASIDAGADAADAWAEDGPPDGAPDPEEDAGPPRDAAWPWADPHHGEPCLTGECPEGYLCTGPSMHGRAAQFYGPRCRRLCTSIGDCRLLAPGSFCDSVTCSFPCDPLDPEACAGGTCSVFIRDVPELGDATRTVTMCRGADPAETITGVCEDFSSQYTCPFDTSCDWRRRRCGRFCRVGATDCEMGERCDTFGEPYDGLPEYGACAPL